MSTKTIAFSIISLIIGLGCNDNKSHDTGQTILPVQPQSDKKSIIIVGINPSTLNHLPTGLRDIGYEPIFILDKNKKYEGNSRESLDGCENYFTEIDSVESISKLFSENPKILAHACGITTFIDTLFPVINTVAVKFSLAEPDPAIATLSEKAELYRLLPEFCPKSLSFTLDTLDQQDFSTLPRTHDWMLKPSLSALAIGTSFVPGNADLKTAIHSSITNSGMKDADVQTWILQEKIPGKLVSLEGFVQKGELKFLGFSNRARIALSEVLNEFPGDENIAEKAQARCHQALRALVERANYKNGYFHCEFIVLGDDAYLIDGNIGRIAGAGVAEQIALSYGLQPKDVIRHVALLPLYPDLAKSPYKAKASEVRKTYFIAYGLRSSAILKSIQIPRSTPCRHTQFAATGRAIIPIGTSDLAAIGGISGFKEDVIKALDQIIIITSEGSQKPVYTLVDE